MPSRYRVILSPRATADLHSIHAYIAQDSPQNAASFLSELVEAIDSLDLLPSRYRVYSGSRRPAAAVRRMPVPPYLIYYRVDEARSVVDIVTVRHGKRRQPRGFR